MCLFYVVIRNHPRFLLLENYVKSSAIYADYIEFCNDFDIKRPIFFKRADNSELEVTVKRTRSSLEFIYFLLCNILLIHINIISIPEYSETIYDLELKIMLTVTIIIDLFLLNITILIRILLIIIVAIINFFLKKLSFYMNNIYKIVFYSLLMMVLVLIHTDVLLHIHMCIIKINYKIKFFLFLHCLLFLIEILYFYKDTYRYISSHCFKNRHGFWLYTCFSGIMLLCLIEYLRCLKNTRIYIDMYDGLFGKEEVFYKEP